MKKHFTTKLIFSLLLVMTLISTCRVTALALEDDKIDIERCTIENITDCPIVENQEVKPAIIVKDGDKVLVEGVDYTYKVFGGKSVGLTQGNIRGIGNYDGDKDFHYYVVPQAPTITAVNAKTVNVTKAEIKATFQKGYGRVTHFELQVSEKADFSTIAESATTNNENATELTINNLEAGKTYYVRVRSYKQGSRDRNDKAYSEWSAITTAKANIAVNKKCKVKEKDYIGTYYKNGTPKKINPAKNTLYEVIIGSIKNGYVEFAVVYYGINGSPVYITDKITEPVIGKKVTFKWKDSWSNEGKGTLQFVSKHNLKLSMKETKHAYLNRFTLQLKKTTKFKYRKKFHDLDRMLG